MVKKKSNKVFWIAIIVVAFVALLLVLGKTFTGKVIDGGNSTNSTQQLICVDSDGGIVYYIAGAVRLCSDVNQPASCVRNWNDVCLSSGLLMEYYCTGGRTGGVNMSKRYICPFGCGAGACLAHTPVNSTNTTTNQTNQTTNQTVNGTLNVTSNPSLANLYVNLIFRGLTPRSVSLAPGSYFVRITKTGYENYDVGVVNILSNKVTSLYAVLVPVNSTNTTTNQTTNGTNATFDFSVSVSPRSANLNRSINQNATDLKSDAFVQVKLLQGATQLVSLSSTGCPSGAACSFSPTQGNPSFNSVFSVFISNSTPLGSYVLSITGTGGGKTFSTGYTLNVTG